MSKLEPLLRISIPDPLIHLRARLPALTLYCVGGSVRNELLGLPHSDSDIAGPHSCGEVARACEEGGVDIVSIIPKLGTLVLRMGDDETVQLFEYTAFRTESYSSGHRPEGVEFTKSMKQDALRRDFTINSLYMDIRSGDVYDPTGYGMSDLMKRLVRSVTSSTMSDDGLRVLRMLRFACEMCFTIDPKTYISAKKNAHKLSEIVPDRVNAEFSRLLLSDVQHRNPWLRSFNTTPPMRALTALKDLRALEHINPALKELPESSINACARSPRSLLLRLAALLSHMTPEGADALLLEMRYPNHTRSAVEALLKALVSGEHPRFTLAQLGGERARLMTELLGALSDPRHSQYLDELSDMELSDAPFSQSALTITGADICEALGLEPSNRVGELKRELWRACVLDPSLNNRPALLEMLKEVSSPQHGNT